MRCEPYQLLPLVQPPGSVALAEDQAGVLVGQAGSDFQMQTINGMQYANLPMMIMKKGDRVRWYLVTIGFGFNFHTPHWHGNVILNDGKRTDVVALSPAQMVTTDMVPDDPGIWLFHCHVSDHMDGGMIARYQVLK